MNVKQVVDSVIEAMSRRGFFKTLGKGVAMTAVAPSVLGSTASQSSQYMRVPYDPHSAIESFTKPLSKYAMQVAEPFVGAVPATGAATSSGIIVTPNGVLIPNRLFQSLNTALTSYSTYMKNFPGNQAILNDVVAQQGLRNHLTAGNLLSRNMREIANKYRLAIDTHLPTKLYPDPKSVDQDFDDTLQRIKAKEKAKDDREKSEKKGQEKEQAKYKVDKDRSGRSRMDYAGGSEDVQGEDYTTLESLTTKIIGLP